MPVVIPPGSFDVPAIVQTAAHAPGNPAAARSPASPARGAPAPRPGPQPLGGDQGPDIIGPPPSPPPPPPPPTTPDAAARGAGWSEPAGSIVQYSVFGKDLPGIDTHQL